jgi:hypothetical protein
VDCVHVFPDFYSQSNFRLITYGCKRDKSPAWERDKRIIDRRRKRHSRSRSGSRGRHGHSPGHRRRSKSRERHGHSPDNRRCNGQTNKDQERNNDLQSKHKLMFTL